MKWFLIFTISLCFNNARAQNKPVKSPNNNDIVIDPISPSPQFPGGNKAWGRFLMKNLKWPANGPDDTFGRVIVSFFVEKDGRLTSFKVERGLGKTFDDEALRVLEKSPRWIPATINGKPVTAKYLVPINFTMSD